MKVKVKRRVRKAGFDLTDFGTPAKFKAVLKANKMRYLGKYRRRLGKGVGYDIYQWGNKDIIMGTTSNPLTGKHGVYPTREREKGYAASIGIKGKQAAAAKLIKTIKKKATYTKGYDPKEMSYVGTGTRPRKKRKK